MDERFSEHIPYLERFTPEQRERFEAELKTFLDENQVSENQIFKTIDFIKRWASFGVESYDPWADVQV